MENNSMEDRSKISEIIHLDKQIRFTNDILGGLKHVVIADEWSGSSAS
jgi:hypothetical protein